ncbi:MAG TPA: universal stress protein [Caldimonas sp.]
MNYPTILVHLDSGPRCAARVALATQLARAQDAHLVGLAPTGMADVMLSMNTAVPDGIEYIQLSASFLREQAEAVAAAFEHQVAPAGLASYEARVVEDEPIDALARYGRCSDLVVIGQSDRATRIDNVAWDFPQQALQHLGRPVLVVPYAGTFERVGERVLVAWKDTREAALAVRDALPLLRGAERVVLLSFAEEGVPGAADRLELSGVQQWLGRHRVDAEIRSEPHSADVGEALLSRASEFGSDLIVMGAYGHSRMREWVTGGVTRVLLARMTVPVLMSH